MLCWEGFSSLRCGCGMSELTAPLQLSTGEEGFSISLWEISCKPCLGSFSGNGNGMLKHIEENAEGPGQIPQLPRKKEKRDFPVGVGTLGLMSLLCPHTGLISAQEGFKIFLFFPQKPAINGLPPTPKVLVRNLCANYGNLLSLLWRVYAGIRHQLTWVGFSASHSQLLFQC